MSFFGNLQCGHRALRCGKRRLQHSGVGRYDAGWSVGGPVWPETPAWVSSVSRAFPIANDNTAQILATSSDFLTGPSPAIFNIPFGGGVDSDWGGLSCDFVEFNKTMVCPQLLFGGDPW